MLKISHKVCLTYIFLKIDHNTRRIELPHCWLALWALKCIMQATGRKKSWIVLSAGNPVTCNYDQCSKICSWKNNIDIIGVTTALKFFQQKGTHTGYCKYSQELLPGEVAGWIYYTIHVLNSNIANCSLNLLLSAYRLV